MGFQLTSRSNRGARTFTPIRPKREASRYSSRWLAHCRPEQMHWIVNIHKLPKTLWSDCGQDAQGRQSGDHGALESEHSSSNIVYLVHFIAWLRFTAAFNWCRFYLFLKKETNFKKMKYFWTIASVKANEWPPLPMIHVMFVWSKSFAHAAGDVGLFSYTKLSQGSIGFRSFSCVFELKAIRMWSSIMWLALLVCRCLLGEIML